MESSFEMYNSNVEGPSLVLTHRLTLEDCACTVGEDDTCITYCVMYNLEELCLTLKLKKDLPVYLTGASNLELEVIVNHGIGNEGPMVLIPVHKTSPSRRGIHN